jgi:hypothetical protein
LQIANIGASATKWDKDCSVHTVLNGKAELTGADQVEMTSRALLAQVSELHRISYSETMIFVFHGELEKRMIKYRRRNRGSGQSK